MALGQSLLSTWDILEIHYVYGTHILYSICVRITTVYVFCYRPLFVALAFRNWLEYCSGVRTDHWTGGLFTGNQLSKQLRPNAGSILIGYRVSYLQGAHYQDRRNEKGVFSDVERSCGLALFYITGCTRVQALC